MSGYSMFEYITIECCDCHQNLKNVPRSTKRCGKCAQRRTKLRQERRQLNARSTVPEQTADAKPEKA